MARALTGRAARRGLVALSLALCVLFLGLGVWQVARLKWKLELIDQVEARIHAPAVPAPGAADWSGITAARDQYLVVSVRGRFLHDRETRTQAVTELGPGSWLMTPLATDVGSIVLINRGFIPARSDARPQPTPDRPEGAVMITGLLRITEPDGGFLRANDPANDLWTSRDVAAIAQARHLKQPVAPYFIDANLGSAHNVWPRGGLTVVRFSNNHLVYALTWFGLAGLTAFGAMQFARTRRDQEPG